jgi:O-antigen ligase
MSLPCLRIHPARVRPAHSRIWLSAAVWLGAALLLGMGMGLLPVALTLALIGVVALAGMSLANPTALLTVLLVLAPMRTLIATEFAPRTGAAWPLPLDLGQMLLIAWLGVWAAHKLAKPPAMARKSALTQGSSWYALAPVLLFTVCGGVSAFTAISLGAWLTEWLKWVQMLIVAAVVIDLGRSLGWQALVVALVAAGLANALVGIYIYFGGSGAQHLLINDDNFRAFGTFGQPNPFGGFMGLLIPLAVTGALAQLITIGRRWRDVRRLHSAACFRLMYYGTAAALMMAALIMSWSRGAWLGLGVSLAVVALALPRRVIVSAALAAALAGGLGAVVVSGQLPPSISARLATISEDLFSVRDVRGVEINPDNYAVIERLAHWQAAVGMATDHPWTGVGLGNYEAAYPAYRLVNWKFPLGHAHNYYLNVLAETGIIGVTAYLAFILAVFALAWRGRQHPDASARLASIGILGTWTYLAVHSLTDNLYVNNVFIHLSVTIGILGRLNGCIPGWAGATRWAKDAYDGEET